MTAPRTKVVGTLGPASSSPEVIRGLIEAGLDVARSNFSPGTHQAHVRALRAVRAGAHGARARRSPEVIRGLIEAGLDVARINFSHGTHDAHVRAIGAVRAEAQVAGRPVAILGDLQGPRIRIGELREALEVADGQRLAFAPQVRARPGDVPVTYEHLASDVRSGGRILADDGLLEFEVLDVQGDRVFARAVHGGALKPHKGLNLPGVEVSAPSLTEKDRADL